MESSLLITSPPPPSFCLGRLCAGPTGWRSMSRTRSWPCRSPRYRTGCGSARAPRPRLPACCKSGSSTGEPTSMPPLLTPKVRPRPRHSHSICATVHGAWCLQCIGIFCARCVHCASPARANYAGVQGNIRLCRNFLTFFFTARPRRVRPLPQGPVQRLPGCRRRVEKVLWAFDDGRCWGADTTDLRATAATKDFTNPPLIMPMFLERRTHTPRVGIPLFP